MSCASRKKVKRKTRKPLPLIKDALLLKTLIPVIDTISIAVKEAGEAANKTTIAMLNLGYYMDLQYQLLNPEYEVKDYDDRRI